MPNTAERLWSAAALNGAQVLGLEGGEIAPGRRADLIVVDRDHVSLAGRNAAEALGSYVFIAGRKAVRDVLVGGRWVVTGGVHAGYADAELAYRDAIGRMMAG